MQRLKTETKKETQMIECRECNGVGILNSKHLKNLGFWVPSTGEVCLKCKGTGFVEYDPSIH